MRAIVGERSLAAAGHFNPALAIASSSSWDKCQHSCAAAATGTATPSISCGCAGAGSSSCANAESSLSTGLSMGGSASLSPAVSESLASAQSSMTDVQQASSQLSELPTQIVPPALLTMLETPGGSRALAVAARSLLVNNPILRHPGAPCHALLTHLASFSQAQAPSTPQQPPASSASSAAAFSNIEGHSQIASQAGSPQRVQGLASDDSASLDQRTRLRMGHDTERPAADMHVSDAQPNIQQEALAAEAHSMGEQASAVRDAHGRCPAGSMRTTRVFRTHGYLPLSCSLDIMPPSCAWSCRRFQTKGKREHRMDAARLRRLHPQGIFRRGPDPLAGRATQVMTGCQVRPLRSSLPSSFQGKLVYGQPCLTFSGSMLQCYLRITSFFGERLLSKLVTEPALSCSGPDFGG